MLPYIPFQLFLGTPLALFSVNELLTLLFCSPKATMSWDVNENFLWWFSFLWTTSDLLSPLIALLFALWIHHFDQLCLKFWLLLIRVTVIILLSHEVCILNIASEIWYCAETTFLKNIFLSNQLNKIHPPLFYTLMGWLLVISLLSIETRNKFCSHPTPLLLSLNLLLLILGSWWAFQEGTWGGWWNWDSSEVLGLIILILLLTNLHNLFLNTTKLNSNLHLLLKKTSSIISILAFLLLQLNFIQSSHSFGIQFDYLFLRDTSITQELVFFTSFFLAHQMIVVKSFRGIKLVSARKWMHFGNFFLPLLLLVVIIVSIPFLPLVFRNYVDICKDLTWIFNLGRLIFLFTIMILTILGAVYNNLKVNLLVLSFFISSLSVSPLWSIIIMLCSLHVIRGFVHYLFCLATIFVVVFQTLLPPVWDFAFVENSLITPLSCKEIFIVMQQPWNIETMSLAFINFDGSPLLILSVTLGVALYLIILFI